MFFPIAASTGRTFSKADFSPPAMIASVASRAPTTAPDTGASTKEIPFDSRTTPSSRVPTGSDELMSTTTQPFVR